MDFRNWYVIIITTLGNNFLCNLRRKQKLIFVRNITALLMVLMVLVNVFGQCYLKRLVKCITELNIKQERLYSFVEKSKIEFNYTYPTLIQDNCYRDGIQRL